MSPKAIDKAAALPVEAAAEINPSEASDRDEETPDRVVEALLKTFFTGLSWTAAARGLTSIGTALRYVVFVRLLKPFDFGVIASAMLVCTALSSVSEPRMGRRSSNNRIESIRILTRYSQPASSAAWLLE